MGARIIGCGSYLPQNIVSNKALLSHIDSSEEWIESRTGIKERRICTDETNLDLAYKASIDAIEKSSIDKDSIDLIIVATTTNDQVFPSVATKLQNLLRIKNAACFDIQAVCTGYLYGLQIADLMSSKYQNILLVGSEKMSHITDWNDRSTCILFGDGAGASIIQRQDNKQGIIDIDIYSDGSKNDILYADYRKDMNLSFGKIYMQGNEVFKYAVNHMKSSIDKILKKNNITTEEIDLFIPHQANLRIINSLSNKLNLRKNQVIQTISQHGNCSAASIPIAISEAQKSCILTEGQLVLMSAFGSGLTWGSCLVRW